MIAFLPAGWKESKNIFSIAALYGDKSTNPMIKRTLYFGNPAYLKTTNEQLVIEMHDTGETKTAPIEDIGLLILDHQQITITQALMAKLLANNTAVIACDHTHHPTGMWLSLDWHTL